MTTTRSSKAHEMARQLLARETAGADEPAAIGAAMQRLCTRVSENLRGSVGDDGYNALLSRVLATTEAEHPALKDIRRAGDGSTYLDGVVASVDRHGVPAVTAALESMLGALADVLSGLIGADMVQNLLDHDSPPSPAPSGGQTQ